MTAVSPFASVEALQVIGTACAGLAVAAAIGLCGNRRGRASQDPAPDSRAAGSGILRIALRLSRPVVPVVERCCPPVVARAVERRLKAAGDETLPSAAWLSAVLTLVVTFGASAGLVAGAVGATVLPAAFVAAGVAAAALWSGPARRRREREREILRSLPAWLDLLTICVEAGSTLTNGIRIVVERAPEGPLREYFARVLREIRSGRSRAEAFRHVADRTGIDALSALATALVHAESSGMSLGDVLRSQARQRGAERFTRAERKAMQAPVRLLAPLVLFIFPCTFIVIALPIVANLLEQSP